MTAKNGQRAPKPANTATSEKKRKVPRTAWKPGQSGNPAGAPKRGESWKELWKKIGDMTPQEAAEYCHAIAGQLAKIGNRVTLKEAVTLRVYAALLFDPDARLLNAIMDRDEGKVAQPFRDENWRDKVIALLREKKITPEEVIQEFGNDLATELFVGAGVPASTDRETVNAGGASDVDAPADPGGVAK